MVDIVVIRGEGISPGDDIQDVLLSTVEAALSRGRAELDQGALADAPVLEIKLRDVRCLHDHQLTQAESVMHPLKQLKQLLQDRPVSSGKVIATSGDSITIATVIGSQRLRKTGTDATQYRPGDEVILANGQIVGRKTSEPTIYVV